MHAAMRLGTVDFPAPYLLALKAWSPIIAASRPKGWSCFRVFNCALQGDAGHLHVSDARCCDFLGTDGGLLGLLQLALSRRLSPIPEQASYASICKRASEEKCSSQNSMSCMS